MRTNRLLSVLKRFSYTDQCTGLELFSSRGVNRMRVQVGARRNGVKVKRLQWLLLFFIILCHPLRSSAQAWSGILDPSRAIDWSVSGLGIPGGIPNRTTNCATLSPGATSSQIDSAIASCPSGQVVFLNAGTYLLSSGITFNGHSNVTLRGAG